MFLNTINASSNRSLPNSASSGAENLRKISMRLAAPADSSSGDQFQVSAPESKMELPDVQAYHDTIQSYPGWEKASQLARNIVSEHRNNKNEKLSILDMGAGSGRSTDELASIPNIDLHAIERDKQHFDFLNAFLKSKNRLDVQSSHGNINNFKSSKKLDAIVSLFSTNYMKSKELSQFLGRAKNELLKKDGIMVIGSEFLPFPGDSIAQAKYHGNVLYKTILDKQPKLSQWILSAWHAAENNTGDKKITSQEFEQKLNEAGFHWKRWRSWPEPLQERQFPFPFSEGGVYVYKAWVPR